jgi:hypothetical protein
MAGAITTFTAIAAPAAAAVPEVVEAAEAGVFVHGQELMATHIFQAATQEGVFGVYSQVLGKRKQAQPGV